MRHIKFLFFALICVILFSSCERTRPDGLVGSLVDGNSKYKKVYLYKIFTPRDFYRVSYKSIIDTALIDNNGNFHFPNFGSLDTQYVYRLNFATEEMEPASIVRDYQSNNYVFLFNNQQPIELKIFDNKPSEKHQFIKSKKNNYFEQLRDIEIPYYEMRSKFDSDLSAVAGNENEQKTVTDRFQTDVFDLVMTRLLPRYRVLISGETDPRKVALLLNQLDINMDLSDDLSLIDSLLDFNVSKQPNHPYVTWLRDFREKSKSVLNVGDKVENISCAVKDGSVRHLHEVSSSLILVDFWASWCLPCRMEIKGTILPLYNKDEKDLFEVFAISFDADRSKWIKAVENDKGYWIQAIATGENKEKLAQQFGVQSLPTSYLLDENFIVLKKNLRGRELRDFVSSYVDRARENTR